MKTAQANLTVTFKCTNCHTTVTETVKRAIEIEIVKSVGGACCKACCGYAYSKR